MVTFITPTFSYGLIAPILIVLGGALIGVLVEAFAPRKARASAQLFISIAALVLSLAALIRTRGVYSNKAAMDSITFDGAGYLLQGSVLIIALIAILLLADSDKFAAVPSAAPPRFNPSDWTGRVSSIAEESARTPCVASGPANAPINS